MLRDTFVDAKINKSLSALNKDESEKMAEYLANQYYLPYIDLKIIAPEMDALEKIPEDFAKKYNVAAFKFSAGYLHLAISDPGNENTVLELKKMKQENNPPIIVYCASQNSINHIFDYYEDLKKTVESKGGLLSLDSKHLEKLLEDVKNIKDYQEFITQIIEEEKKEKITKILETMLAGAIHFKTSDIHIEPEEKMARFRFRIDGNLHDIFFSDLITYNLINNRLKLLSGLKLSINSQAQDGRFSIDADFGEIEVRVSLVPGAYGESYVMRILDPRAAQVDLEILGFNDILKSELEKAINKPYGLILTTGPTGSGKSTTLYACVKKVYNKEVKIMTIEDPVEYHMDGVVQTQVDNKKGYTFLSGLRAALRQDPDIIMVGEIRDSDTATTAANAALTGHVVFSTLHTNTAAGAIPRLMGLGVDIKTLTSSVNLIMAQRLCRKLCPECKIPEESDDKTTKIFTKILGEMITHHKSLNHNPRSTYQIFKANHEGCPSCNDGYKGRVAICEGLLIDKKIEDIISNGGREREIRDASDYQGIPSLREDGVIKILEGITSLEELQKVVDLNDR